MSNKFDKLINKKINETKLSPSSDLWGKIEASLDEKENKKVLILPFLSSTVFKNTIAASAIFLLGGLSVFFYMNTPTTNTQISKNKSINSVESHSKKTSILKNEEIVSNLLNKSSSTKSKDVNYSNKKYNSNNKKKLNHFKNSHNSIQHNTAKYTSNLHSLLNPDNNHLINNSNSGNNTSAKDYIWIFDKQTNAFQVVLKENDINENSSKNILASTEFKNPKQLDLPMMSLTQEEESFKEENEVVEIKDEDDGYKQFRTKIQKLNYQGFWLGPNIGYKSLFIAGGHYAGGSFGIDFGYDFGGSFGIQTGLLYAINSKNITLENVDENDGQYKSEFNSLHVPLLMRYKITKMAKNYSKPLSFNLLAGADYAFLDRKKIHQLGFIAGAEYDIFTQADLMFTLGLRGGIYNNLNIKNVNIPEKITPFSYSLDAYLSVRFIDWVKKRK